MSLKPLLDAAPAIPVHAFAAMAAFALGVVQIAAPKGTLPHRTLGWIWVALMAVVVGSSFWIHQLRVIGPWSPIHLLSIFSAVMLVLGVWYARRHNVRGHRTTMISIFGGALIIAGLFTFMPGRIMHTVLFGP
jgi:uncharacterized membrane protein